MNFKTSKIAQNFTAKEFFFTCKTINKATMRNGILYYDTEIDRIDTLNKIVNLLQEIN